MLHRFAFPYSDSWTSVGLRGRFLAGLENHFHSRLNLDDYADATVTMAEEELRKSLGTRNASDFSLSFLINATSQLGKKYCQKLRTAVSVSTGKKR